MKIVFIHPNFPAQFRNICNFLGKNPKNEVVFVTSNIRKEWDIPGVKKIPFLPDSNHNNEARIPVRRFSIMHAYGEAVANALMGLRATGFIPDLIVGTSGWGSTFFIKDIYPEVPFLCYFEWFFDPDGENARFQTGEELTPNQRMEHRSRNLLIMSDLDSCDHGFCPTEWQKQQIPTKFHSKLSVVHEGIDTQYFRPEPVTRFKIPALELPANAEIVTYTSRGFEPFRGFPQFIESIPLLLKLRPHAHVVIVGKDRVCYSPKLPDGQTYKTLMAEKVPLDPERVHFLDTLPYDQYRQVLQASFVHVYLTVPYVLSWSTLEAMSCGCLLLGSDTPPVREVIQHSTHGMLADFHQPQQIAETAAYCLEHQINLNELRQNARTVIIEKYSIEKTIPMMVQLMEKVSGLS